MTALSATTDFSMKKFFNKFLRTALLSTVFLCGASSVGLAQEKTEATETGSSKENSASRFEDETCSPNARLGRVVKTTIDRDPDTNPTYPRIQVLVKICPGQGMTVRSLARSYFVGRFAALNDADARKSRNAFEGYNMQPVPFIFDEATAEEEQVLDSTTVVAQGLTKQIAQIKIMGKMLAMPRMTHLVREITDDLVDFNVIVPDEGMLRGSFHHRFFSGKKPFGPAAEFAKSQGIELDPNALYGYENWNVDDEDRFAYNVPLLPDMFKTRAAGFMSIVHAVGFGSAARNVVRRANVRSFSEPLPPFDFYGSFFCSHEGQNGVADGVEITEDVGLNEDRIVYYYLKGKSSHPTFHTCHITGKNISCEFETRSGKSKIEIDLGKFYDLKNPVVDASGKDRTKAWKDYFAWIKEKGAVQRLVGSRDFEDFVGFVGQYDGKNAGCFARKPISALRRQ